MVGISLLNLIYLSYQDSSIHIWGTVKPSLSPLSCCAMLLLEQFHLNFFIYSTIKLRISCINNRQQLLDCYASVLLIFLITFFHVKAIDRGIFFELLYTPAIKDSTMRRYTISNAISLMQICKGKVSSQSENKLINSVQILLEFYRLSHFK